MNIRLISTVLSAGLCLAACSEDRVSSAGQTAPSPAPPANAASADTVMAEWEEALGARFRAAIALDEAEFVDTWDAERDSWLGELQAVDSAPVNFDRVRYEWAYGRMLYPVLHARITQQPRETPSAAYERWIDEIEFSRPDLLALEEYTGFISTRAEMQGDALFDDPQIEFSGRAQYLDARLTATEEFEDPAVRCFLQAGIFEYWLESYDGNGTRGQFEAFAQACPGERTDEIMARFATETEALSSLPSYVYKTVDGHALEVFVTLPDGHSSQDTQPAALFFHGGGWFFGNWSWCGPCRFFKERGHVVVQVEYRARGRFRSRPGDALDDAMDAIAWVRANADELGVDPSRIAATGFSAGAHLSMTSGALLEAGDPRRPDLIAAFSGCAAMDDADYTIRTAGSFEEAVRLSPVRLEAPSSPPIFFANARRDTDCDFDLISEYADKLEVGGTTVFLHDGGQRGHFFMRDPDAAAAVREDLFAFLDQQGW